MKAFRPFLLATALSVSLFSPAQAALDDALKPFPAETVGLISVDIQPITWLPLLAPSLEELYQQDFYKEFHQGLSESLGVDFEKDMLPNLGTHLAIGYGYGQDQTKPRVIISLHLKSGEAFRPVLQKMLTGLLDQGLKVYPATLQGTPIWKIPDGSGEFGYLALTANHLITSYEEKPEMLGQALTQLKQTSPGGLLAKAEFASLKAESEKDAIWFYGKAPRSLADMALFENASSDHLARVKAIEQLFSLLQGVSGGMSLSKEGFLFHSRNLYAQQNLRPGQKNYVETLSKPSGLSLDPLLATVPASHLAVFATERLPGYFNSPLSDLGGEPTREIRQAVEQALPGKLIQTVTSWKPEQYLPLLDGRFSASYHYDKDPGGVVMALGVKAGQEPALRSLVSGLKVDLNALRDLDGGPEARATQREQQMDQNLSALSTMLEAYKYYNEAYPNSLSQLQKDAEANGYWTPLTHPLGKGYPLGDFRTLKQPTSAQMGQVFYEPIKPKTKGAEGYYVYAYYPTGRLYRQVSTDQPNINVREDLPKFVEPQLPRLGFKAGPAAQGVDVMELDATPEWKQVVDNKDVQPVYAFSDGLLLIASRRSSLEEALAAQKGKSPSLLADPAWQQRSGNHVAKNAAFMFYTNLDLIRELANKEDPSSKEYAPLLDPIHYFLSKGDYQVSGDFSQSLLQIDMSQFNFATLAKRMEEITPAATPNSVKSNMHTLQTMIETYAVDWGGIYPESLEAIESEAKIEGRDYWKDFSNPYTQGSGIGFRGSMINFSEFSPGPEFKGLAIYQPVVKPGEPIVSYKVFGVDETGKLLQDKGKDFYLTNS